MVDNHWKCRYCDKVFPQGCEGLMFDHLAKEHTDQARKMIDKQYIEVAYVNASERKDFEKDKWIPVKSLNRNKETEKVKQ
jgi:hypothetical protein